MAANLLLAWVVTGPRSVSALIPYIEKAMTPAGGAFTVTVQGVSLVWDGWRHPVDIRVTGVSLLTGAGSVFATFPEVSLGVHVPPLLTGQVMIKSLMVRGAGLQLQQAADGQIVVGFGESGQSIPLLAVLAPYTAGEGSAATSDMVPDRITIQDAKLSLTSRGGVQVISAPHVNISLGKRRDGFDGQLSLMLVKEKSFGVMHARLGWNYKNRKVGLITQFTGISPQMIQELYPLPPLANAFTGDVSGSVTISGALDGTVEAIKYELENYDGVFSYPQMFPKPIEIQHALAKGLILEGGKRLVLTQGKITTDETNLAVRGNIDRVGDDIGLNLYATGKNMPVNNLERYWPLGVAEMTRSWVTKNIRGGTGTDAEITVNFHPGDFRQFPMPQAALFTTIHVKDTTVNYMKDHPPVTDVDAELRINGKSFWVDTDHAKYLSGTVVEKASLFIDDLNPASPRMKMNITTNGPLRDAVAFLEHPDLDLAKTVNLSSASVKGEANTKADLNFLLFPPNQKNPFAGVKFVVDSQIKDAAQPKFMGSYDLGAVTGKLHASNDTLTFDGRAAISGVPLTLAAKHDFTGKQEYPTEYKISGDVPVTSLPGLGVPKPSMLAGTLGVDAVVKERGVNRNVAATLDLKRADVALDALQWKKASGLPGSFRATLDTTPDSVAVKSFDYQDDGVKAVGSALLGPGGALRFVRVDNAAWAKNNLSLAYGEENGVMRVEAKGSALDLTNYLKDAGGDYTTDRLKNLRVNAQIGALTLGAGRVIQNMTLKMECGAEICEAFDARGSVAGDKPFAFSLTRGASGRVLSGTAADAGVLFSTLGMYQNMQGGALSLNGTFNDAARGRPVSGTLKIGKHTIVKAPVLTKILTIASISGALDTLQGNGIAFAKLHAPFVFSNNLLTLKEAKTFGPALGLTADGTLDLKKKQMDLHGTIVPSYTLNSVVGKIPLFGQMLTGGEGQGVFAAKYTLKGKMEDPDISINPLSILTPGFLRNLFDIFDAPAKGE